MELFGDLAPAVSSRIKMEMDLCGRGREKRESEMIFFNFL